MMQRRQLCMVALLGLVPCSRAWVPCRLPPSGASDAAAGGFVVASGGAPCTRTGGGRHRRRFCRRRLSPDGDRDDDGGDGGEEGRDPLDRFLDTPFYDPDRVLDDDESSEASKRFARFVKSDYETAESLIAGGFFLILIVLSQELVRMQVYGSDYVPFVGGGGGGSGIGTGRLF